jgi:DNA-directed RNA polymerase subunit RPC12/RpoP
MVHTIGKISQKKYRCTKCGFVSYQSTNHYGQIYPRCQNCGWKHPMEMGQAHECLEKLPKGWKRPENWKMVKLGDVAEIKIIKAKK